jgi:hypothetical protein
VVYVFSATDPEFIHNLEYFVREGMQANDRCDYVVVVQQPGEGEPSLPPLPSLPPNARYIPHGNECYDWGTFGWLLRTGQVGWVYAGMRTLHAWTACSQLSHPCASVTNGCRLAKHVAMVSAGALSPLQECMVHCWWLTAR